MTNDGYKNRLAKAKWSWREDVHRGKKRARHKKDRQSGRQEKRGARNDDKREISRERERQKGAG